MPFQNEVGSNDAILAALGNYLLELSGVITNDTKPVALDIYLLGIAEIIRLDTTMDALANYLDILSDQNNILQQTIQLLRQQTVHYYVEREEGFVDGSFSLGPAIQKQPASKKAIQGLEKLLIDEKFGDVGPCAVCLEKFLVGDAARRLHCSHFYHTACIME
ncbi:hypothetical protein PTKIN_Ptkin07bG0305600 [Pterospermum kingtungense]